MRNCAWVPCNGEAHGNPMIDHCMVCLPGWGRIPVCPEEGCTRTLNRRGKRGRFLRTGRCPEHGRFWIRG